MTAGATPKLIKSIKESNSAPNFEVPFINLAILPSIVSIIDASLDKASEDNERNLIKYSNNSGKTFAIVQIAGLVARRIVCEVKEGQNLNQGDRIGIIRFGSRVDLYFDNDYKLLAKQGQTVVAGESLLAKI